MLDLWYKNAVVYCLDVETFQDSNGDGIGDIRGLTERLDHIEALGATCVWLLPFYPSPNRDNGYDITDFYAVDPRLGTLGDFVAFTHAAQERGLRVIVDFVANHTSIDHPWFQASRRDPTSPFRDWYVWSKEKPENIEDGVVFPGVQQTTWSYDEVAQAWYMHRFYEHQADLNTANPAVREELERIMGFWLQLGVSGFRLDAVPFLIEYRGLPEEDRPDEDPHEYLEEIRDFVSWRKAGAMLLAEANIEMHEAENYFGPSGNRLHTIFNFPLNQNLFLALARGDAAPVRKVLETTPKIPPKGQWATFLRNHDELDLGRLSTSERQEVFDAMGPEPTMQIYERGLRRRLAPMLDGDPRRIFMAFSLMFALPGMPVIWYGDEIGMGEDLSLKERNSVRTPMQWTGEDNAGFSRAPAERLVRKVVSEGPFAYAEVNAMDQRDEPGSLLTHVQRLVRMRRGCPEIGWGECEIIDTGQSAVLALRYSWAGKCVFTLHNFGDRDLTIELPDACAGGSELLYRDENISGEMQPGSIVELGPYGYHWSRVTQP